MTEFIDANGKTWRLKLTIDAIDNINAILNRGGDPAKPVDLLELTDAKGKFNIDIFMGLTQSPRRTASILAEAMQWERDNVAEARELADGLRGDAVGVALSAFVDELAFFFPERLRPVLRTMLGNFQGIEKKAGELTAQMLSKTMDEGLQGIASLPAVGN